jgi:hypothetical protein
MYVELAVSARLDHGSPFIHLVIDFAHSSANRSVFCPITAWPKVNSGDGAAFLQAVRINLCHMRFHYVIISLVAIQIRMKSFTVSIDVTHLKAFHLLVNHLPHTRSPSAWRFLDWTEHVLPINIKPQ